MDWEKTTLRVGAAAVAVAILFRLMSVGGLGVLTRALTSPEFAAAVLLMETGRAVKPGQTPTAPTQPEVAAPTQPEVTAPTQPETTASTEPTTPETVPETTAPEAAVAVFAEKDASLVSVNSVCGYEANVKALLQTPLSWDLTEEKPTVLIIHSHATESYKGTSGYRSKNEKKNVVAIGAALEKVLEKGGIQVVHDKTLHDSPSYNNAYNNARQSIEKYLKKYPSIRLVLDIHRDSVEDESGKQMQFTQKVDGTATARLMLVVGTDAGGLVHPNWPENMSLAVKLHAQLEKNTPGICRAISFRSQRFNQDLSPGALIVEVGSAGNTQKEALAAVRLLGNAIIDLAQGANEK